MERNLRLYLLFHLAHAGFFWLPVYFLLFSSRVGASEALELQSIYYLCFVVLEVPSGYISDRFGRRPTLIVSALCGLAGGLVLFGAEGFWWLALGQVLLAAWHAFFSGTDQALLFDSLSALGREEEFARIESRVEAWARVGVGLACLVGGLIGQQDLALPYLLFAGACVFMAAVSFFFVEPQRERAPSPLRQTRAVFARLKDPALLWVFVFLVGMLVVNHVPFELFQGYVELAFGESKENTPLITGAVAAANMFVGAAGARLSVPVAERLGYAPTLVGAALLQVALILAMGAVLHPVVALLLATRSLSPGLTGPLLSSLAQHRLRSSERATFFSLTSLLGRTAFAGVMALFAWLLDLEQLRFEELGPVLRVSGLVALGFVLVLALSARALRSAERGPSSE